MNSLLFFTVMSCTYSYYGAPFATIEIQRNSEGFFDSEAKITQVGRSHYESFEVVESKSGEFLHAWISNNTPNAFEMIVYEDQVSSKIINPPMPFEKEMDGVCEKR